MGKSIRLCVFTIALMFVSLNIISQTNSRKLQNTEKQMFQQLFRQTNSPLAKHSATQFQNSKATTYSGAFKVKQDAVTKYRLDSIIRLPTIGAIDFTRAKFEFKYDILERIILRLNTEYNEAAGKYVFVSKDNYIYEENSVTKNTYDYYNSKIGFSREKTVYDELGRILYVKEGRDSINFESSVRRTEYLYENNMLNSKLFYESYSNFPSKKIQFFYDEFNRDTAEITMSSSFSTGNFVTDEKTVTTYDNSNKVLTRKSYDSNWSGNWLLNEKLDYIYDEHNDCVLMTESSFYNDEVDGVYKYVSSYNTSVLNINVNSGFTFVDFPFSFQSQLNTIDLYLDNTHSLVLRLYYSELDTSTKVAELSTAANNLVRYNGVNKNFEVLNSKSLTNVSLQIFTLNGILVQNTNVNTQGVVETTNLSKGIYVYKLICDQSTTAGKLIVQ